MYYTRDPEQANNTQCCLFSSVDKQVTQDNRVMQDGLIGSQEAKNSARGNAGEKK